MDSWKTLLAVLLLVLQGCVTAAPNNDKVAHAPESLEAARQLWQEKGVANYTVTAQMSCYCSPDLVQPIRLEVRQGDVVAATGLEQPLQNLTSGGKQRLTVEGLFRFIEQAAAKENHQLEVSYDPEFGFPASVNYGGHPRIADDERKFRLTNFVPGLSR